MTRVSVLPPASLTAGLVQTYGSQIVTAQNSYFTGELVYSWDFGDGESLLTSNSSSASHNYTSPGNYTLTLFVSNGFSGASVTQDLLLLGKSDSNTTNTGA